MNPAADHELNRLSQDLVYRYDGTHAAETVRAAVREARQELEGVSTVATFLPILVERRAKDLLRARARDAGVSGRHTKDLIFVDRHNTGRSQLAAALAQHLADGPVHVHSAGTRPDPAGGVQAEVVQVLAELGIDGSTTHPSPVTDDLVHVADVVVALGVAPTSLPAHAQRLVEWDVPDPAGADLAQVRSIRDQMRAHVAGLLTELGIGLRDR